MKKETYDITGMTCSACSARVEKTAAKLPGVRNVSVNLLTNSMRIEYDESTLASCEIVSAIEHAGYGAAARDTGYGAAIQNTGVSAAAQTTGGGTQTSRTDKQDGTAAVSGGHSNGPVFTGGRGSGQNRAQADTGGRLQINSGGV